MGSHTISINPTYVNLTDVPLKRAPSWEEVFQSIPDGKAIVLRYNNRQRAHQVRSDACKSANYWGIKVNTALIHEKNDWLVYIWIRKLESHRGRGRPSWHQSPASDKGEADHGKSTSN